MDLERIEPLRGGVNEVAVDSHSRLATFYSPVLQGANTNR
jgi:hypothetical protein